LASAIAALLKSVVACIALSTSRLLGKKAAAKALPVESLLPRPPHVNEVKIYPSPPRSELPHANSTYGLINAASRSTSEKLKDNAFIESFNGKFRACSEPTKLDPYLGTQQAY
jgi:hypothetical protein